jgi:hypothetical protein
VDVTTVVSEIESKYAAAAPGVAGALGYDIEAALEDPDDH